MLQLLISIVELCKNLEQKVGKLEEKNKILEIENAELRERLGLNSRNSSLPSSKELYKIKKDTPEDKSEGGRKIGGQVGHKGNCRAQMEANEVVKVKLPDRCECGEEITISEKPYVYQKVDLPEIKPYVVEYQLEHGRCRKCGKRRSSKLPEGVTPDTFGPRVKSVVAALSGFYKNSKREIANIMKDIFNMSISVGSVSNSEARVSSKCKEAYEQIEEEMKASKILHIDETSHYNKGKLGWCWMFANNKASFMKLADTRGMKFLKNSAFCDYKNLVITDRYAVYNHFSDEKRQICWAHLLRNFERLSHSWNSEVMRLGHCLKDAANGLFALKNALSENEISISKFTKQAKELRRYMQYCMIKISYILEAKGASRTVKGIIKSEPMMWTFLDDPGNIPLTNNHVERQIRHYVVYRKNSYFAQSERGNRFLERIISLYLTWRQKELNPFQNLLSISHTSERILPNDFFVDAVVELAKLALPARSMLMRIFNDYYNAQRFILDESLFGDLLSDYSGVKVEKDGPVLSFGRKNSFELKILNPSFKFSTFRVHYEQAFSNDIYRLDVAILGETEPHTKNYNGIYERNHVWYNFKALYPLPQSLLPAIKFAKAQVILSDSWSLGEINACFPVSSVEEKGNKFLLGSSKLSEELWNLKYKPILERFSVAHDYKAENYTDQKITRYGLAEHNVYYKNDLEQKDSIHELENYILVFYPGVLKWHEHRHLHRSWKNSQVICVIS